VRVVAEVCSGYVGEVQYVDWVFFLGKVSGGSF